jgi:hypothetical protein
MSEYYDACRRYANAAVPIKSPPQLREVKAISVPSLAGVGLPSPVEQPVKSVERTNTQ